MAISSEWAGLPVSPTLPYLRVSKVCLMPPGPLFSLTFLLFTLGKELYDQNHVEFDLSLGQCIFFCFYEQ